MPRQAYGIELSGLSHCWAHRQPSSWPMGTRTANQLPMFLLIQSAKIHYRFPLARLCGVCVCVRLTVLVLPHAFYERPPVAPHARQLLVYPCMSFARHARSFVRITSCRRLNRSISLWIFCRQSMLACCWLNHVHFTQQIFWPNGNANHVRDRTRVTDKNGPEKLHSADRKAVGC